MTAPTEHRTTASAGRGERWIARCSCKWWTPCTGKHDASDRMWEHRRIADARNALRCDCYDPDEMEYDPAGECARCILDQLLAPRRAA